MKERFQLRPDVVFLNHGSFGSCPRSTFEVFQQWQRRLETQPVLFMSRQLTGLLQTAREALAGYVRAAPDEVVYIPNSTHGVNIVARSLKFEPGDEILGTDHEYGACERAWRYLCRESGAVYRSQPLDLPLGDAEEQFWSGVSPRTRLIFLSHITSPTALRLPVERLVRRAREAGIMTLVDGAHAPGQIPLDLAEMGVDFYTGNCHKWLCAPKGVGFLYARRDVQPLLQPLVISWGWEPGWSNGLGLCGTPFLDYYQWMGTTDPCASLTVPTAIALQQSGEWQEATACSRALARDAKRRLEAQLGVEPLYGDDHYHQMFAVRLPADCEPEVLQRRLYDEHHIEVIAHRGWRNTPLLRVCIAVYNSAHDIAALQQGLTTLLPQCRPLTH